MLAKRIIPCLDVKDDQVVKGIRFTNHIVVGDIIELAQRYQQQGADELVFYAISASPNNTTVCPSWVNKVAAILDIPFCVAGGITSLSKAEAILAAGADKISINTPAINNPNLITQLAKTLGSQCVVVGIDSFEYDNHYYIYKNTGDPTQSANTGALTSEWIRRVQDLGAGEIVLNCMNADGTRNGYDCKQLQMMRSLCNIPLIASGGAGTKQDFLDVFKKTNADGALAASVFHNKSLTIPTLKSFLQSNQVEIRQ